MKAEIYMPLNNDQNILDRNFARKFITEFSYEIAYRKNLPVLPIVVHLLHTPL